MAEELKKEFSSLTEAFGAMHPQVQSHCIRVSEYVDVLFLQACASELYIEDAKTRVRLKTENRPYAIDAGRYHDIGKALVPEVYQSMQQNFSVEEIAVYRKHVTDGSVLAEELLSKEKDYSRTGINIVKEGIESHHERWDGSGFPKKEIETETCILGRILAVADALDHMSVERVSERPFEYAVEQLLAGAGVLYDPQVVNLVKETRLKLKKIFKRHISDTKAIPATEVFIRRKSTRPFALWYRPVMNRKSKKPVAYEAQLRFREGKNWVLYPEVEHIVKKNELLGDLTVYSILEACDVVRRLEACTIPAEYVGVQLLPGCLNRRGAVNEINAARKDEGVRPEQLCLIIPAASLAKRTKTMSDHLTRLGAEGYRIMVSDCEVEQAEIPLLQALGVSIVSLSAQTAAFLEDAPCREYIGALLQSGIQVYMDGLEKNKYNTALNQLEIKYMTGLLAGDYQSEDELVEGELSLR